MPIIDKRQFIVLCGQIVGSGPFQTIYGFDGRRFDDRQVAIRHGFRQGRSDDFNIGVIERGKLVSLDWMGEPVDTDPVVLSEIQQQIQLEG